MSENIGQIKDYLKQIVEQEFLPHLFSRVDSHIHLFSELSDLIGEYSNIFDSLDNNTEYKSINGAIELNKKIFEKLESKFQLANGDPLLSDFGAFENSINDFIAKTEKTKKEIQPKERFYYQQGEKLNLRAVKYFKRNFYRLSVTPLRIKNIFLGLFKKPTKAINYWNHKIPLRNLRSIYVKSSLFSRLSELYKQTLSEQTLTLLALKSYYEESDKKFREKHLNLNEPNSETPDYETIKSKYSTAINSLKSAKDAFKERSDEIIERIVDDYLDKYLKAGTIELSKRKISSAKVIKSDKEFVQHYNSLQKGWYNTLFALADDWRMDNELYLKRYSLIGEFLKASSVVSEKLSKSVIPSISLINKAISDIQEQIGTLKHNIAEIEDFLTKSRYNLKYTLTEKLLPQIIDKLFRLDILNHIDEFEDIVERNILKMSEKRAIVKTDVYDKEIKDSEISYISLRDMLLVSSLPKFKSSVLKSKADQSLEVQKIQNELLEIDQICDISLNSAQIMLQGEKKDAAEVVKVVIEGFDRAMKKIDEINNQLLNLNNSFTQKTKEPLDQLCEDLINLTFTESVLELKINIAKDRALQTSREVRKETIQKVKNVLPHLFSLIKEGYNRFTKLYSQTKKLIGIEKTATIIKGEVSNFLSETGEAINKLPFVYQRLFVVEPIEDERFFFGREEEFNKLSEAYDNWSAGKFSPTIIYGEKGSGITSLINVFIKKKQLTDASIRISVKEPVQSKEDFLNLLSAKLTKSETVDFQDLIETLNNKSKRKKIVVLENLQHLFLRRINGFENLKLLFELMSETNENVFWITTCTLYSYRYLQKTIAIAEYFACEVEFGELNDKQIINIILKRHRVSGYDIYYKVSESVLSNKNFQKLSDEEKQAKLEKAYFSALNEFADSNISLALLFWVRSTSAISENRITIGHLPKIDFSFLSALSNEKMFLLNILLIHDGLIEEDVSSINGVSIEKNRRLLFAMEDDGILVRKDKLFLINPLLYRPVVEVLKSKNIIQ